MKIISEDIVRETLLEEGYISAYRNVQKGLGRENLDHNYIARFLDFPLSLCFAIDRLLTEDPELEEGALDSISFFHLLSGLFLPLSGMSGEKIESLFSLRWAKEARPHKEVIEEFLNKDLGLSLIEKTALLMGDPFLGENSWIGQETLLQILSSLRLTSQTRLREDLPRVCDIGILFVEEVSLARSNPPVSAREVMVVLSGIPDLAFNRKKQVLRDLFSRCGRLERYFLARLILRRLSFGYEYRKNSVHFVLSKKYRVPTNILDNAVALSDIFTVTKILEEEGPKALSRLVLKPLNPVSPALASTEEVTKKSTFPLWTECKYDGIRLMIHKETDLRFRTKYAAFTRRKHNWLELISGLEISMNWLSAHSFILDGELHGKIYDWEKDTLRPCSVYELYRYIQGDTTQPIKLFLVVFDILYLNGQELIALPFYKRRETIERLITPLSGAALPIPITLSEGWQAEDYSEFNKWYRYFLNQGYEGVMAKDLTASYALGKRTNFWLKKKTALHLDLVISGAMWATGERGPQVFSGYVLSCRQEQGFLEIARAEGLALEKNAEIIQRMAYECLMTGESMEVRTARGVRSSARVIPVIVVTVRFEGIVRDSENVLSLRDPKIIHVRPRGDIAPEDTDTYESIERLYLKYRLH